MTLERCIADSASRHRGAHSWGRLAEMLMQQHPKRTTGLFWRQKKQNDLLQGHHPSTHSACNLCIARRDGCRMYANENVVWLGELGNRQVVLELVARRTAILVDYKAAHPFWDGIGCYGLF